MSNMVMDESYGEITRTLSYAIKAYNVPPAFYWTLEDIFIDRDMDVDHGAIERFIKANSERGQYNEPWPLDPVQVVMA